MAITYGLREDMADDLPDRFELSLDDVQKISLA
jgi:hypothetical protein